VCKVKETKGYKVVGSYYVREDGGYIHSLMFEMDGVLVVINDDTDDIRVTCSKENGITVARAVELYDAHHMGGSCFHHESYPTMDHVHGQKYVIFSGDGVTFSWTGKLPEIISYIDYPYDLGLDEICSFAKKAIDTKHVRHIDLGDRAAVVVWRGPDNPTNDELWRAYVARSTADEENV